MDSKYEQDFPTHGSFNWKTVILKLPNEPYYNNHKTMGVLFLSNEFEIIDENPLKLK